MIPLKSQGTIRRIVCPRCNCNRASEHVTETIGDSIYRSTTLLCKCSDPRDDDEVWKEYCEHLTASGNDEDGIDYPALYKALMEEGVWTETVDDEEDNATLH